MKINELVEFVRTNKNKMFKAEQLQEMLQKKLEVKKYIGIKDKKQLVEDIVDACIIYEDGVYKFDDTDKYICFIMKTIEAYTNIELSDDPESDYDVLCSTEVLELVVNTFKKEYDDVNVLLQMKCDYILSGNTIEAQIGKFLSGLSDKIDVIADAISNKIDNFDLSKLPIDMEDIKKLTNILNMQK